MSGDRSPFEILFDAGKRIRSLTIGTVRKNPASIAVKEAIRVHSTSGNAQKQIDELESKKEELAKEVNDKEKSLYFSKVFQDKSNSNLTKKEEIKSGFEEKKLQFDKKRIEFMKFRKQELEKKKQELEKLEEDRRLRNMAEHEQVGRKSRLAVFEQNVHEPKRKKSSTVHSLNDYFKKKA